MSEENRPGPVTEEDAEPRRVPRFVPILIGAILALLAGLAIYTGLESREETLGTTRFGRSDRPSQGGESGPPGEPVAGASRVVHGEGGDQVPQPGPWTPPDRSKVAITGGPGGVEHVVRVRARRGLRFDIDPPDAMVYVNGAVIGSARQFTSSEDTYEFAEQGSFEVVIVAPGHKDMRYEVTADPAADSEVVVVRGKLEK
jgi:hypothetical protein